VMGFQWHPLLLFHLGTHQEGNTLDFTLVGALNRLEGFPSKSRISRLGCYQRSGNWREMPGTIRIHLNGAAGAVILLRVAEQRCRK
jgi:hypothetical protein